MRNFRNIKAVLLMVSSMTVMAGAIIAPALPGIDGHFPGRSEVLVQLVLTMPALMIALMGAPMGFVADRFGRTRLLVAALLLYGIAGFAGFLIDSFPLLLVSRAFLGVAVAGVMGVSTTLIGDYFEAGERSRFLGTQASFMALGGIVFLNVGGLLAEWSWRGPFLVYLLGFVMAPLAWKVLFEPARHQPGDVAGTGEPAAISFAKTATAYTLGFYGMLLFYMIPAQMPFLLNRLYQAEGGLIGLAISVATITAAAMSFAFGRLKQRLSVRGIYTLSLLLIAAGYGTIAASGNFALTIAGIACGGAGFGLTIPNGNVWIMSITPRAARGRIIGGFSSMIFLGQFLSPLAVAPLRILTSLPAVFLITSLLSVVLIVPLQLLSD